MGYPQDRKYLRSLDYFPVEALKILWWLFLKAEYITVSMVCLQLPNPGLNRVAQEIAVCSLWYSIQHAYMVQGTKQLCPK